MIKKSIMNISFVSAGNILNAFLGFLFLSAVAQKLPIEEFGKYALLTTLLVSLSKIMDFGTNSIYVAQNFIGTFRHRKDFVSAKFVLFIVSVVISTTILAILRLSSPFILIVFVMGLVGYGINISLFAYFQKNQEFKKIILLNTIPAAIKTSFALMSFAGLINLNTESAFSIFSISILGSTYLLRHLKDRSKMHEITFESIKMIKKASPAGFSQLIREGWPAMSNTIAKMAGEFAGVGIFSLAEKIANIFTLISLSIFTVLLPQNSERKRQRLKIDYTETIILSVAILLMAVGAIFISKVFVSFAFGGKFLGASQILGILICSSALTAIYTFMENYFFVVDKPGNILFINTGRLGTFFMACVCLIPIIGISGLAWSHLISSFVAVIITILFAKMYKD